ncbi:protein FAM117A [Sinocyclocheilus grahami]|uniref:protein FAM117A n=1 Tax=Sinocyclocheilus grahami TaxID=75366 RepID=UPI0007AD04C0|nr:PREDICTED: protein FAM117A-like [Sinocyclocheilus grahami]
MKMSRNRSGLQPLKATVPFTLHKAAGAAVTNITPGDRTQAEWRLQTPIRHTVSLDAIVGSYLQGQWPKEGDGHDREDKSTQVKGFHLLTKSLCVFLSSQSPALLIPPASLTRLSSRLRQSEERLDLELEKVFTHNSSVHHCGLYEVPDGHRAPVPHLSSRSGFQIGSSCVASLSSSSSSTSCSPHCPLDLDSVEEVSSCILKLSSSPRPNNSYCFQRDPPEGCERVRVCEENVLPCLDQVYMFSCPDPNKVNFSTHTGSAFCPVNLPRPLLPPVDFLICSLSVSPGSCWVGQ